jgi:hypothetical protein
MLDEVLDLAACDEPVQGSAGACSLVEINPWIGHALAVWKAAGALRSAALVCGVDQQIRHLYFAFTPILGRRLGRKTSPLGVRGG